MRFLSIVPVVSLAWLLACSSDNVPAASSSTASA
jgi:hypothetical protein